MQPKDKGEYSLLYVCALKKRRKEKGEEGDKKRWGKIPLVKRTNTTEFPVAITITVLPLEKNRPSDVTPHPMRLLLDVTSMT